MKNRRKLNLLLMGFLAMIALNSCVSVAAYQKAYLNDSEMALQAKKLEVYETNFQAYREGAAGANGGKSGGGCGCN
ncbi:DUF4266 domain-containing protein [Marinifilum sp. RC60d5]|uniref:DUF4266 domain-containing protein n=1 Tax=Marinifilum sp. RC60d5 TaxID=3458414 RepID=UPI004036656F